MTYSPDGTRLLVEGARLDTADSALALLDSESGEVLWELNGLPRVREVAFFPDGERFVHSTFNVWDNALFIRSCTTGELLGTLVGHAQPASLGVSPDGLRIVSGNWDSTMSLCGPERVELLMLPTGPGAVAQVAFSADGGTIASLEANGRRRFWTADPALERPLARQAAAQRRRWSADARARVDELWLTEMHPAAIVKALEIDGSLLDEQRQAAILVARSTFITPVLLCQNAGRALSEGENTAIYLRSLEAVTLAAELSPRDHHIHALLAAAQIRLELFREALHTMERADELRPSGQPTAPWVFFLRAIAHLELGDREACLKQFQLGQAEMRIGRQNWSLAIFEGSRQLEREVQSLLDGS